MIGLLALGMNHASAPVEVRERFALHPLARGQLLNVLLQGRGVREMAVLSTCNRTEIYLGSTEGPIEPDAVLDALFQLRPLLPGEDRHALFRVYRGEEVARHALRVAAGLDSLVLGETQILAQMRQAYDESVARGAAGPRLHRLFAAAFKVAKRAHSETEISAGAASVGSIAVELAAKVFDDLERRSVLLLGAGDTGETIARTLCERRVAELTIAGRGGARAADLAERFGARSVPLEQAHALLSRVDIALTAAAPPPGSYALTRSDLERALEGRRKGQLLLIDVGVPRNVEPAARQLSDVFLYDLDDLVAVSEKTRRRREKEAPKVEAFVEQELASFRAWLASAADVGALARELRERFEAIGARELERTLARVPAEHRPAVEAFARSLVDKLVQAPVIRLKQGELKATEPADLVRELFGLAPERPPGG